MRIGVQLPQGETGFGADLGLIRDYAQAAESLGFRHLRTGDHVLGAGAASRPGWQGPYDHTRLWHEPFVLFGYLAAVTRSLELVTSILVLPQRQTALVAKQAAQVDVVSGGRLRLGVGVGWNVVEYEALGQGFRNRGERFEEQIDVLRALWTRELVTFEGRWHRITDAGLNPMPIQRPIPVWIGAGPGSPGSTPARLERVLRRIARKADGWFPSLGMRQDVGSLIARLREYVIEEGRDPSDVGIEGSVALDEGTPEEWAEKALAWQDVGVTHLSVRTVGSGFGSLRQHTVALEEFRQAVQGVVSWS